MYLPPGPVTPMPDYDAMNTPALKVMYMKSRVD